MIEVFAPALLNSYLKTFRKAFSKSGYTYFTGFIWALMLIHGRKRVCGQSEQKDAGHCVW
jgi:hypothetical protein